MGECISYLRFPIETVSALAHQIFNDKVGESEADNIGCEATKIIYFVDRNKRSFFNGRTQMTILSGLFLLLAKKHSTRVTITNLCNALPDTQQYGCVGLYRERSHITQVTIRMSARRWLEAFPQFF